MKTYDEGEKFTTNLIPVNILVYVLPDVSLTVGL